MIQAVKSRLAADGIKCQIVPIGRLKDLINSIEKFHTQGKLYDGVYDVYLSRMIDDPTREVPNIKSIIVTSTASPMTRASFKWRNGIYSFNIPPTYSDDRNNSAQIQAKIEALIGSSGYRCMRATLPKKLLAVQSGLASYGRNNISYVPGFGSFHVLAAYYSDLPCEDDSWRAPVMMESCLDCLNCLMNCPTGAITEDDFLLDARHCIAYYYENPGHFPDWINPEWFEHLIGCTRCQTVCPENLDFLNRVGDSEEFSEEETGIILESTSAEMIPPETAAKLTRLDMFDPVIISRNLRVLLKE